MIGTLMPDVMMAFASRFIVVMDGCEKGRWNPEVACTADKESEQMKLVEEKNMYSISLENDRWRCQCNESQHGLRRTSRTDADHMIFTTIR